MERLVVGPQLAHGDRSDVTLEDRILTAVELADTDGLLRIVDGMCASRRWDDLVLLRMHCREAVERGKQLWGVDEHIRYRLALEGPDSFAASVIDEGPARFTLGPLPEVAAQTHTWADLGSLLAPGPERAMFAHERALRGEAISPDDVDQTVLDIPVRLCGWEPDYPLAEYASDRAEFPTPRLPSLVSLELPPPSEIVSDDDTEAALLGLVTPWVESSNGVAEVRTVEGTAAHAIAALGVRRVSAAEINPPTALSWMGWAAASGGAHGRRRGAASGRFATWWACTVIAGLEWPVAPEDLGRAVNELRWVWWSDGTSTGWTLRLAIEDPIDGLAWVITATDARADTTDGG